MHLIQCTDLAIAGALLMVIIVLLRWYELAVTLIIAVHIFVDWYLDFHLVALLMALVLLFVYLRRALCRRSLGFIPDLSCFGDYSSL